METKAYTEIQRLFTEYLEEKKLRKTEERYTILKHICAFGGHFELDRLHDRLEEENFHVSKATLYNTLEVLLDARLIIRHQLSPQVVQYELRVLAETHHHLICSVCQRMYEIKNSTLKEHVKKLKISRFTPEYHCLYIYGLCSKCKYKIQCSKSKNINGLL